MKRAISIPDPLFAEAERAANELSLSRSEISARAVAAFLKSRGQADVTQRLNEVQGEEPSSLHPVLMRLHAASISREAWSPGAASTGRPLRR
jgi:hypothetical protein